LADGETRANGLNTDHVDVVVIGAGQAGLAIGYFLARQDRRFVILERARGGTSIWL
jgi:putative flavoprotein involved in K+ transport